MKRWTSFAMIQNEIAKNFISGLVLTIGNFDGVHLGHQKILERVKKISMENGWYSLVVSFKEHTSVLLRRQSPLMLLSLDERCNYFESAGMDGCLLLEFTPELAQLPAESFLEKLVSLGTKALVVGHDFTFGAGGAGNTDFVLNYAYKNALYGEVIPPVKYHGKTVCSSRIRSLLTAGKLSEANGMLNRPFRLAGKVEPGNHRGKVLGFPTANLAFPSNRLLPKFGVYFVRVFLEDNEYYGLANVGLKPTFNHNTPLVEVHLFDFSQEIYGCILVVDFLKFLREERKFVSPNELVAQMVKDKKIGKQYLSSWLQQA
ncbi:MAG TPA: riboflavin biosynthesis protein RibF [Firmicutes bacterium]|nr:riboflavin biosynthesis protein RibF [Bacillota bacterium]HBK70017.1 riboflavin biosynthesis protein RibF [Bacillota bacterium]HBT17307.1 riboflavin biosynthesis protein RibF [Bacillota bacterium]